MERGPRQPSLPSTACPVPIARKEPAEAEEEEVDIWWGAFAGRTMVPLFVLCGLLTLGVWALTLLLRRGPGLPIVRYTAQGVGAAVWFVVLAWTAYRVIAVNYRLTSRRLLYRWGFQRAAQWEIELTRIAAVRVECRPLERLLGVGRLRVTLHDGGAAGPVFAGVVRPSAVARMIDRQIHRCLARSTDCGERPG
jgi:hypothetical protein